MYEGIDKALKEGATLRIYRNGAGLRCVFLEVGKDPTGTVKGCARMPQLIPALVVASLDYLAGGLKADQPYLTGSSECESDLDRWILQGNKISGQYDRKQKLVRIEKRTATDEVVAHSEKPTFYEAIDTLDNIYKSFTKFEETLVTPS